MGLTLARNIFFSLKVFCLSYEYRQIVRNEISLFHASGYANRNNKSVMELVQRQSRIKSNEFRIDFYRIYLIIFHLLNLSNRIERIKHLKNLTPPYSWNPIESNKFRNNFHRIYRIFLPFRIANFRIESNKFRTNSNLTPTLKWSTQ